MKLTSAVFFRVEMILISFLHCVSAFLTSAVSTKFAKTHREVFQNSAQMQLFQTTWISSSYLCSRVCSSGKSNVITFFNGHSQKCNCYETIGSIYFAYHQLAEEVTLTIVPG